MRPVVTAVPGDDPRTFRRVLDLVDRAGADLRWEVEQDWRPSLARTKVALVGHRRWTGQGLPPAVALREALGVFAQHRPIRPLPGVPTRHPDVDLLVVRETTEDVYAHLEHESLPGVYESVKVTTRAACERIARHAFDVARRGGRQRVTVVHKANIMKLSDGMFLRTAMGVAEAFPDIECDEVIVDALCMRLVLDPSRFDVLLCGNLYGDIVGDLCAGLVGGPSNAPSVNHATDGTVLYTAGRGDPPGAEGTDGANPLPVLLPAIELLYGVGRDGEAERLHNALARTFERGVRPHALGGDAGCEAFCAAVEGALGA